MSRMDTIQGGSLFKGALNGDITVAVKENPRKVLRKFFWSGLSGFTHCITGNNFITGNNVFIQNGVRFHFHFYVLNGASPSPFQAMKRSFSLK